MRIKIISLAVFLSAAQSTLAADLQPGLWELTLETRVPASPDFAPAPNTAKQCLTEHDAQDPSRVLGSLANPEVSNCTFTENNLAGYTLHFKMQCAGTLNMQTVGDISYSATTMEGSFVSTANILGQTTEIHSKVTAHRLGGC